MLKKLLALFVAVAMVGTGPLLAGTSFKEDRGALVSHLQKTRKALDDATKGLTAAQWNYKPAPDRWSVAECLEHIALSEDFLFQVITDKVMKTPAAPEKKDAAKAQEGDAFILNAIPDRSRRAQAPEQLQPTGKWATPKEAMKHFAASRKFTINYVKATQEDLRSHFMDSPIRKDADGHQWVLFLSAHSQRHTAQILEVKADPNFPKK